MSEEIVTTVKAYYTGNPDSKIVTIPKRIRERLGEENTDLFVVKLDRKGRIVLEPIRKSARSEKRAEAGEGVE